jgi:hypothetical protein
VAVFLCTNGQYGSIFLKIVLALLKDQEPSKREREPAQSDSVVTTRDGQILPRMTLQVCPVSSRQTERL